MWARLEMGMSLAIWGAACSSSSSSNLSRDGSVGGSDAALADSDAGVSLLLHKVDTSLYLRTSVLNVFPEGPIILNGLNLGPLNVANIGPGQLIELNSDSLASNGEAMGEVTRQILAYAYSCALPASSSMQLEIGGEIWQFDGALGLAPEWESGACDAECQEWVSACILARTNQFGVPVELSLRGDHAALTTSTTIKEEYSLREGSFYGNIFTGADTIAGNAYACAGGKGSAMWELTDRFCSAIGDGCPIMTVADCNVGEFACDIANQGCSSWTACSDWTPEGLPTVCYSDRHKCSTAAPGGTAYRRIITAYIKQPVADCGNGICEEGEADLGCADCANHWAVRYGSGCHEDSGGLSVHKASGDITTVGRFIGSIDFGAGGQQTDGDTDADLFIANVDSSGASNWSLRVDASRQAMIRSVATDSNGDVVVAGHFAGQIDLGAGPVTVSGMSYFVAKYTGGNGTLLWSEVYESNGFWLGDELQNMPTIKAAIDSDDGVVVVAEFRGTLDLGLANQNPGTDVLQSDLVVFRMNGGGTRDWHTKLAGVDHEAIQTLALDSNNNIVLGGRFRGDLVIGQTTLSSSSIDGFVAKLSPAGEGLWAVPLQSTGDRSQNDILSLAVGGGDEIIITGSFLGTLRVAGSAPMTSVNDLETGLPSRDGLVAKFSSEGVLAWGKSFGDARSDSAEHVAWNGTDSYVVATRVTAEYGRTALIEGTQIDSGDNGDIVLIRYLRDGSVQSVTQRGGPVSETPTGLVASGDAIIMVGQFMGTLRFSGTYLTNAGGSSQTRTPQDIFLTTVNYLP